MAQRKRQPHRPHKPRKGGADGAPQRAPVAVFEKKIPIEYGKPFILMEDEQKNTFVYKGGQWIAHSMSVAECKQSCQVKELPQKVNRMTRYEICLPLTSGD